MSVATTAVELYDKISNLLQIIGLYESHVLFSSEMIPEPVKHKSFRLLPALVIPHIHGATRETALNVDIAIAFHTRPEAETSIVKTEILPVMDKVIDTLVDMQEHDPSEPINAEVTADEEQRFAVLTLVVRFGYCRHRTV